ncbi:MAG: hypothetical protein PHQ96_01635 [Candidatus Omnitrophica bacterium]|nr:hypothetical protein [Candidatus Omnitrophota bacterium]
MNVKLENLDTDFKEILAKLPSLAQGFGYRIYVVGGVVRDLILANDIFDLDIVVEGDAITLARAFAQNSKKEFKKHHAFGTATVYFDRHSIDFATARKETYSSCGVLPKVYRASLREDLLRRDFTINAMAISLNSSDYGTLIDFYSGLADLEKRVIRVLHKKSFLDDPTRLLRAIRFAQRFSFKIEKNTARLIEEAVKREALQCVHPHRLRDELILILKEPRPEKCIRAINSMMGFSFVDDSLRLIGKDYVIFGRLKNALSFYQKNFPHCRKLDAWVMYLTAMLYKLSSKRVEHFLRIFDFRKGDRVRVLSTFYERTVIQRLSKPQKRHIIYRALNDLSFESIMFFYAFFRNKQIRSSINIFLKTLAHLRLKVKGDDLKGLGIKPHTIYGKILEKLLDDKLDMSLATKDEEMRRAVVIAERLSTEK